MIDVVEALAESTLGGQQERDGDYVKDGILYCGVCNEARQTIINLGGRDVKAACMCKCDEEKHKAEEEERIKRDAMRKVRELKKASLMENKFANAEFSTSVKVAGNVDNLIACKRYAKNFSEMLKRNQGLLLYGNVGTGKSHAAACIANYLLQRQVPVVMTSFINLVSQLQHSNSDDTELLNKLNYAKLLILDDLGAERATEFSIEKVYNIIDSRNRAKLPIIVTCNLSLEEMNDSKDIRYKRIYDRILETCYPMKFTGESFRKEWAKRNAREMEQLLFGKGESK